MLEKSVFDTFNEFVVGDLDLDNFTEWIKVKKTFIENVIGYEDYRLLTEVNRKQHKNFAQYDLSLQVSNIWAKHVPLSPEVERTKEILRGMIEGTAGIISGCKELARLFWKGNGFIPIIFVGFDSELDKAIDESSKIVSDSKQVILPVVNNLLNALEKQDF